MKTQFLITLPAILLSVNLFSQVTSVDVQASPSEVFGSSGGPVTTSGTITISLDQQQDNKFLASPSDGSLDDPEFRGIEDADLPIVEEGTQGIISNNTGSTQILGAGDKEFPDRCFFADGATFDNDAPSISFHSSPSTGLYLTTGAIHELTFLSQETTVCIFQLTAH